MVTVVRCLSPACCVRACVRYLAHTPEVHILGHHKVWRSGVLGVGDRLLALGAVAAGILCHPGPGDGHPTPLDGHLVAVSDLGVGVAVVAGLGPAGGIRARVLGVAPKVHVLGCHKLGRCRVLDDELGLSFRGVPRTVGRDEGHLPVPCPTTASHERPFPVAPLYFGTTVVLSLCTPVRGKPGLIFLNVPSPVAFNYLVLGRNNDPRRLHIHDLYLYLTGNLRLSPAGIPHYQVELVDERPSLKACLAKGLLAGGDPVCPHETLPRYDYALQTPIFRWFGETLKEDRIPVRVVNRGHGDGNQPLPSPTTKPHHTTSVGLPFRGSVWYENSNGSTEPKPIAGRDLHLPLALAFFWVKN